MARRRWVKLELTCDVEGCSEVIGLAGQTRTWPELYRWARECGWSIREDSLDKPGGSRRRCENQSFCPQHRSYWKRPGTNSDDERWLRWRGRVQRRSGMSDARMAEVEVDARAAFDAGVTAACYADMGD